MQLPPPPAAAARAAASGGVAMGSLPGSSINEQLQPGQMETSYSTTGERVLGAARAAHLGQATASTVSHAGHEEEGLSVSGLDWSRLKKPPLKKQQERDGELQQAQSLQHRSSCFGGVFRKQSMHSQQAPGSTTSATPPGGAAAASIKMIGALFAQLTSLQSIKPLLLLLRPVPTI